MLKISKTNGKNNLYYLISYIWFVPQQKSNRNQEDFDQNLLYLENQPKYATFRDLPYQMNNFLKETGRLGYSWKAK